MARPTDAAVGLRPLEIASGLVTGEAPGTGDADAPSVISPRKALEDAIADALSRPPCLVAFSGGRDSSAILALAVTVARREGLQAPIAATKVYPGRPDTDESAWQEEVVARLGVSDWVRIELGEELDIVGPVAERVLRRHGVLIPANTHFQVPVLERARGGTMLTGIGGDELFASWSFGRLLEALRLRRRPAMADLRRLAVWSVSRGARRGLYERFGHFGLEWLTPAARGEVRAAWADDLAGEPRRWERRVHWLARRRWLVLGLRGLELVAADAGARVVHPLLDPPVVSALAKAFPAAGPGPRADAMRALFGDVLPEAALTRRSKARFDSVAVSEPTRAFVEGWEGETAGPFVDLQALRQTWRTPGGPLRTASLIQALWLDRLGSANRVEEQSA